MTGFKLVFFSICAAISMTGDALVTKLLLLPSMQSKSGGRTIRVSSSNAIHTSFEPDPSYKCNWLRNAAVATMIVASSAIMPNYPYLESWVANAADTAESVQVFSLIEFFLKN
jgi:NAD(P)-dependent dehydrogenase (short-subunit alcohol dehydrogenase family)